MHGSSIRTVQIARICWQREGGCGLFGKDGYA
jgi:hypothetical protein